MTDLELVQRDFYRAIAFGHDKAISEAIVGGRLTPAQRLRIYRNNAYEGFRKSLSATYPVVERLLGQGCFRGLALDYVQLHPSCRGDLTEFGRHFPRFLTGRYEHTVFGYLTDVASLEWAYQEAMCAADASSLRVESLADMHAESWDRLCLCLHPAVRLLSSDYPVLTVWNSNREDPQTKTAVDLERGGERVVLHRTEEHIEFRTVDVGEFALLSALDQALPFGTALEQALSADPRFDLERTLIHAFGLGLFSDYTLAPESPSP